VSAELTTQNQSVNSGKKFRRRGCCFFQAQILIITLVSCNRVKRWREVKNQCPNCKFKWEGWTCPCLCISTQILYLLS